MFRTLLISMFMTNALIADTWTVDDDGFDYPFADFSNIQSAIDAASDGDEVLVYPGTYTPNNSLGGGVAPDRLGGCSSGDIPDCNGNCAPLWWLGDGECDEGQRSYLGNPIYFNCAGMSWDIGDCEEVDNTSGGTVINPNGKQIWIHSTAGPEKTVIEPGSVGATPSRGLGGCSLGDLEIPDCNGNCAPLWWLGDGECDEGQRSYLGNPIYFNCDDMYCDGSNTGGPSDCDCGPEGACCIGGGECWETTEGICSLNSGEYLGDGISCSDADCLSGHAIMCVNGETNQTIIEGFTISGWQYTEIYDGGAAAYIDNSSPALANCIFTNNTAEANGGAMYCFQANPVITDCIFNSNTARNGGGMYCNESNPILNNCTFSNNTASWGHGGAINCFWESSPMLTSCTFENNDAIGFSRGGGMYTGMMSTPTLMDCTFAGNSAESGGGLYNDAFSNTLLTLCTFMNNTADENGGGMYNFSLKNDTQLTGCDFIENDASDGGGLYNVGNDIHLTACNFSQNSATGLGGGVYLFDGQHFITNCSFTENSATYGGGILSRQCDVTMNSCSMSGNYATSGPGINSQGNANLTFVGLSSSDGIRCQGIGSTLLFTAESVCNVTGNVTPAHNDHTVFNLDDLNTTASLLLNGVLNQQGGLSITNDSGSLFGAQVGDVLPLAQAETFNNTFSSTVFPLMPDGLGLQLTEYPALRGGSTETAVEVIDVDGVQFDNPFTGDLDSPPVDIESFDADGDGADEIAVLFDGAPGGVAVFAVSEDGAPSLIDGFSAVVGNNPVDLDAGDLNGDGLDDILVANSTGETMTVLVTTLGGDNELAFAVQQISCFSPVTSVAVIDWDGDADLDAVVGLTNPSGYQVLLDVAASNSSDGPWFAIPVYDIDPDPDIEVWVPDPPTCVDGGDQTSSWGFVGGTRYGRVHRVVPSGSLQVMVELSGNNIVTIEAADLDDDGGDGQIDLMVSSDEAQVIYLFQGNAAETDNFDDLIPLAISENLQDLLAIDADSDGDMDLVFTAAASDTPLLMLRNDGGSSGLTGSLSGRTWSTQSINADNPIRIIAKGNLDDKGEDDDWIIGAGTSTNLRGEETSTMEQTNILVQTDCPADLTGDGNVAIADLLQLIAAWGTCETCPEDFNGDGAVAIADLLTLIAAWGPCK